MDEEAEDRVVVEELKTPTFQTRIVGGLTGERINLMILKADKAKSSIFHPEGLGVFLSSEGIDVTMTKSEFKSFVKMLLRLDEALG